MTESNISENSLYYNSVDKLTNKLKVIMGNITQSTVDKKKKVSQKMADDLRDGKPVSQTKKTEIVNYIFDELNSIPDPIDKMRWLLDGKGEFNFLVTQLDDADLIPDALKTNLVLGAAAATNADHIFTNLMNFPFTYSGGGSSAKQAFLCGTGDCGTLVNMYCAVAQAYNVPLVTPNPQWTGKRIVDRGANKGKAEDHNTEGEEFWAFDEHFWVQVQGGQVYDLLFMMRGSPNSHAKTGDGTHNEVKYQKFSNSHCLIRQSENSKLKNDAQITTQGRVFVDENTTKTWIDSNKKP